MQISAVKKLAKKHGWTYEGASGNETVLIFSRTRKGIHQQVDVYHTTHTVKTSLKHPKQKKTQLFRRHVDMEVLEQIFINPRVHTTGGYHNKEEIAERRLYDRTRVR
jgi:hypothetical protein